MEREKLILVTGANGFIGSHLAEALLEKGYRVRCMVRRTSDLTHVEGLPVEWAYADVGAEEELHRACTGIDAVCHCAALTRALDREAFLRVNAGGTVALARACLAANPGLWRFLFVSSQAAAGPSQGAGDVVDETHSPRPVTWYGESKQAAEQALGELADRLPLTVVRPSAVFGPRDRDFFAYFDLVRRGLSLQLGRHPRQISLIYVRDLIDLLLRALASEEAKGQTYFGCGPAHSYRELSDSIARALDRRPLHLTLPEAVLTPMAWWARLQGRLTGEPALLNDQRIVDLRHRFWLCSGEKARRELGFEAQYDLDRAVQQTADWYLENGWL